MTIEYLDLADYLAVVAEVTGLDLDTVLKVTDAGLADSALSTRRRQGSVRRSSTRT